MLEQVLKDGIERGHLRLERADGRVRDVGAGTPAGVLQLHDNRAERRVIADPDFMLGQTYIPARTGPPARQTSRPHRPRSAP